MEEEFELMRRSGQVRRRLRGRDAECRCDETSHDLNRFLGPLQQLDPVQFGLLEEFARTTGLPLQVLLQHLSTLRALLQPTPKGREAMRLLGIEPTPGLCREDPDQYRGRS